MLEGGYTSLDVWVRMGRHLHLHSFQADTQMLKLIVIFSKLVLSGCGQRKAILDDCGNQDSQIGDAVLKKENALSGAFSPLNEKLVNMLGYD